MDRSGGGRPIRIPREDGRPADTRYVLRAKERPPLGTDFTKVADRLAKINGKLGAIVDETNLARRSAWQRGEGPLSQVGGPTSYTDATGMGEPFCDFLAGQYPELDFVAVTITSGEATTAAQESSYKTLHVGKEPLVVHLAALLGRGALQYPANWRDLDRELRAFVGEIRGTGSVKYGALPGEHDDFVIAVALATYERARTAQERLQIF